MLLGIYICDRGEQPAGIRLLNSQEQDTYIVGRPYDTHRPDVSLHHGKISRRHVIIIFEDPGYWTVTAIGRNPTWLIRNGLSRCLSKGDAVPIEDDDCLELLGSDYSVTFKTNPEITGSEDDEMTTISGDDDDEGEQQNFNWLQATIELYKNLGLLERFILMITAIAIAIPMALKFLHG